MSKNLKRVVHLRMVRVISHNGEGEAIKERPVVKLMDGWEFNNFLEILPTMGVVKKETEIVGVFEINEKGEPIKVDSTEHEQKLKLALNPVKAEPKDYKKAYEDQESKNNDLQKQIDELKALIGGSDKSAERLALEAKAKEFEISFNGRTKDENLLSKIKEIDPDFSI